MKFCVRGVEAVPSFEKALKQIDAYTTEVDVTSFA